MKRFLMLIFSLQLIGATWSPTVDIGFNNESRPIVKVDAKGDAVALWASLQGPDLSLQSASLPFNGTWTAPLNLSTPGFSVFSLDLSSFDLALDPQGNAVAFWVELMAGPANTRAVSATYISGTWSSPMVVSLSPLPIGQYLKVAIDPRGNAVAVWMQAANTIFWATLPFGSGTWTAPTLLAMGNTPDLAIDSQGNAVAVWTSLTNQIDSANLPFGAGAWGNFTTVSPLLVAANSPSVEIDPHGNAVAIWATNMNSFQAATLLSGATTWTNRQTLSTSLPPPPPVASLGLDGQGNAFLLWADASMQIFSAFLPFGGAWEEPQLISPTSTAPQVAVDSAGNAVASWAFFYGGGSITYASTRIAGGLWTQPVQISGQLMGVSLSSVAIDPQGNAVAVWGAFPGGTVQASTLPGTLHQKAFLRPFNKRPM